MVREHQSEHESEWVASVSIASKIGCTAETLRRWVRQTEKDNGQREGLTTVERERLQAIRFLLDRFDLILLPTFETQAMSAKSKRKIRAKSVRAMLGYAFFRFGQRLESAAKRAGKVVLRVNEAYTSKTASWTGEIKSIGGAKTITSGGVTVDRDINGARGIFLRALVDTPSLRHERACVGACEQALA